MSTHARSGIWYAALLGDAQSLAALGAEAPEPLSSLTAAALWGFPHIVLGRLALAAASDALTQVPWAAVPAIPALLAELERHASHGMPAPFRDVRPDFSGVPGSTRPREAAVWHLGTSAAYAARAWGPYQARGLLDADAARATELALAHAVDADRCAYWAADGRWARARRARHAAGVREAAERRLARAAPPLQERKAELARQARMRAETAARDVPPEPLASRCVARVVASVSQWLRDAGPFAIDVLRVGVCRVVRDGRDAWLTYGTDGRLIASHDRPPRP